MNIYDILICLWLWAAVKYPRVFCMTRVINKQNKFASKMEQLSPEEVKLNPGLIEGLDGEFIEIPIEQFISSPESSKPVQERIITRKSKVEATGTISKQTELF